MPVCEPQSSHLWGYINGFCLSILLSTVLCTSTAAKAMLYMREERTSAASIVVVPSCHLIYFTVSLRTLAYLW